MSCAFHPERTGLDVCSACGRRICAECGIQLNDEILCRACIEERIAPPERSINGPLRLFLSLVPGLGHLYMGLFQRGLQLLGGTVLGAILLFLLMPVLNVLFLPAMVFFSLFDAREMHLRLLQEHEVADQGLVDLGALRDRWNPRYTAYVLIAGGALALYNVVVLQLIPLLFPLHARLVAEVVRGVTLGLAALICGIVLLRRGERRSQPDVEPEAEPEQE